MCLENMRPELVVVDWARREAGAGCTEITFGTVRNVGTGTAFNVSVTSPGNWDPEPAVFVNVRHHPLIAPREDASVDGNAFVDWGRVASGRTPRECPSVVTISCFDRSGRSHKTTYRLEVFKQQENVIAVGALSVAPGLILHRRSTSSSKLARPRHLASASRLIRRCVASCLRKVSRASRRGNR